MSTHHTPWAEVKARRALEYPEHPLLWVQAGSTVYGTAIEGTDDRDEILVVMETPEQLLGVSGPLRNHQARTAVGNERSAPGDTDRAEYSLRSFASLAMKGNASVLVAFFAPEVERASAAVIWGQHVRRLLPWCLSMRVVAQYQGYMRSQMEAVAKSHATPVGARRPELVEAHGYDTKAAMHATRLALQCLELAETGTLELPIEPVALEFLRAVRLGQITYAEWRWEMEGLEDRVGAIWGDPPWPEQPDTASVNKHLIDFTREYWNW